MEIPNPLPRGTTREQWDRYELDKLNHDAFVSGRRQFLARVLIYAEQNGIDAAEKYFTEELNRAHSMDAPNEPGYYRATND